MPVLCFFRGALPTKKFNGLMSLAVEINTSCTKSFAEEPESKRAAEYLRMFSLARECGVKFTFGSDAHSLKGHDRYIEICQAAASLLGLSERDIAKLPIKN